MKAIIPAAGYATRLYPLTKDFPKPLIKIGNKPMLNHVLEKIDELHTVDEIIVISNDRFHKYFLDWKKNHKNFSIPISILNDGTTNKDNRLGAIGDKHLAIKEFGLNDDLLDISADNLFKFSLLPMYKYFKKKDKTVIALYDVKTEEEAKRFGIVNLKGDKIISFHEKPQVPPTTLASIGIYMYPKRKIKHFDTYLNEGHNPDAPGHFLEWLHKVDNVLGYSFTDTWFDIGNHDALAKARELFGEHND